MCISQDMNNLMTSLHKVLETTVVQSPRNATTSPLKIRLVLTPTKTDGGTKRGKYFKVTKNTFGDHFCDR